MPTIRFQRIERWVQKRVPCRGCGKKLTRSITLGQTLSPYNTNEDFTPKTAAQIRAELEASAEQWHPYNDICPRCDKAAA